MDLREYLETEGVKDWSACAYSEMEIPSDLKIRYETLINSLVYRNGIKEVEAFYDFVASTPLLTSFESALYDRIVKEVPKVDAFLDGADSVLDVGCGSGFNTIYYALQHPSAKFVVLDLSMQSLLKAQERAKRHGCDNITFVRASNYALPFSTKFDCVVAEHNLHESAMGSNPFPLKISEISRVLGEWVVGVLSPQDIYYFQDMISYEGRNVGIDFSFETIDYTKFGSPGVDLMMFGKKS